MTFKYLAEETLRLLRASSVDATYSPTTRDEIMQRLKYLLEKIKREEALPVDEIKLLFAPTGCIQETAIDNGWADKYFEIAEKIDSLIHENA